MDFLALFKKAGLENAYGIDVFRTARNNGSEIDTQREIYVR
jgi:hypothetical protein